MEEKEILESIEKILKSKNLIPFERMELEEVAESLRERIENPLVAEGLPKDNRKQHYSNPYKRKIEGR